MFLCGVFLGKNVPNSPPPSLVFSDNTDFESLDPELGQVFFIGDGLTRTGEGVLQKFEVPAGATRLFLGLADALDSNQEAGYYANNTGQFQASVVPVPDFGIEIDIDSCQGQALITVDAGEIIGREVDLTWYLNGVLIQDAVDPFYITKKTGLYNIEVSYNFEGVAQPIVCDTSIFIELPGSMLEYDLHIIPTDCGVNNGALQIAIDGDPNELFTSIDGMLPQHIYIYDQLSAGSHLLTVSDDDYCSFDTTFIIPQNPCRVYIPNAFSPNDDGINDILRIGVPDKFLGQIRAFRIYDRWGSLLHKQMNLPVDEIMWDGKLNSVRLDPGVYIYMLEVEFGNGNIEILSGDISIVR
jgi:gliding motility-associated-like protein